MKREEFDRFADEYTALHANNVRASGEDPAFFAEYKVLDLHRLAVHTDALDRMRAGVILDFGGGVGNSTGFLAREFPGALLLNVDVSLRSLRVARGRNAHGAQVAFDGATLPLASGSVDAAMCACVFHHISADEHVAKLAELHRVLKPAGLLMVYEHNPLNPLTRRAVDTCPFDENAQLVDARSMRARFLKAGFGSATIRYRLFFPHVARRLRQLERYLYWLPAGAQYLVYATR